MNSLEILVTARKLISDPEHWTQGSAARTSRGLPTHAGDIDAVCWCSEGAVLKATHIPGLWPALAYSEARRLLKVSSQQTPYGEGIAAYNDSHTHQEVLSVFDSAIEKAKESNNA